MLYNNFYGARGGSPLRARIANGGTELPVLRMTNESNGTGPCMKSNIIKAAALILLSVFACAALVSCANGNDSPALEHSVTWYFSEKDQMTSFFSDDRLLPDKIAGAITAIGVPDGRQGFVTAATALYRIDTEGLLKIYPAAVTNAVTSLNTRFILFATSSKIFLYDNEAREYAELPDIEAKRTVSLVLSPDGGTAGVSVLDSEGRVVSYIYQNGRTAKYGDDLCLCAVSNGGEISYYMPVSEGELTGELYYRARGKDKLVAQRVSNYFEVNRDLSEITFDVGSKTHISRNGEKAVQLVDGSVFSWAGAQYASQGGAAVTTLLKNCGTLLNSVFYTSYTASDSSGNKYTRYNVYYIDKTLSASKLAGGASQFSVSKSGAEILCVVDNGLYRVSAFSPQSPETVAAGVGSFCCSEDFKTLYIVDVYGNLRQCTDGTISKILVTGVGLAKLTERNVVICLAPYDDNGTLLWLRDDKADTIAGNVSYFDVYRHMCVYLTNYNADKGTYDLYTSADGVSYELAIESVRIGNQ